MENSQEIENSQNDAQLSKEKIQEIQKLLEKNQMISEARFTDTEYQVFIKNLKKEEFKAGEALCTKGDEAKKFFIVDQGEVAVQIQTKEGNIMEIIFELGNIFGESGLLVDNTQRTATVVAKGDSVCWTMDKETFQRIYYSKRKGGRLMAFFNSLELLREAGDHLKQSLCQQIQVETYNNGEHIINQVRKFLEKH